MALYCFFSNREVFCYFSVAHVQFPAHAEYLSQRGYFDAQIGLSNAIRDELIAVVQVYKALGGGWQVQ